MKAVMYGGGNIGRGFIGALLSRSGYEVTFIDVAEPVIQVLQERKRYPVRIVSTEGHEDVWVENVTAVNGNLSEAVDAIANCDIMATAEGMQLFGAVFASMLPKEGDKVQGGFEMNDSMMQMMGGFTMIRLAGMIGTMGINLTKEQLLAMNAQLNQIKKPAK